MIWLSDKQIKYLHSEMIWLSDKQIKYLHSELIKATGGSDGLRDDNLLQAALLSPLQTYNFVKLFPTVVEKATRLACGLTQNHPFIDGNKRIGAHAMLVTLKLNDISLSFTQQELSDIFLRLAASEISFAELNAWVHSHISEQQI